MKILIMMTYFNRPLLAEKALKSIIRANEHHSDWELGVLDDNSKIPIRPILKRILKDHLGKVSLANSKMSFEDKVDKGLMLGRFANFMMRQSDADLGIILCDDDMLFSTYLKELDEYYYNNPEVEYAYSKVSLYNPLILKEDFPDKLNVVGDLNKWEGMINPVGKVDASQVSWRLESCRSKNAWFNDTTLFVEDMSWAKDTDRGFFENMYEKLGEAYPTGLISEYKGVHDYQLLWHKKTDDDGLEIYYNEVQKQGGKLF